jgi:hypothetical protein
MFHFLHCITVNALLHKLYRKIGDEEQPVSRKRDTYERLTQIENKDEMHKPSLHS